jgi:hypothetical protein
MPDGANLVRDKAILVPKEQVPCRASLVPMEQLWCVIEQL